ncbi:MAG: nucleoside hydrolase [Patescibacteria group bacterium]
MKKKIIIDTDPGQDDAMALMLAIKSGLFNILAITTVCGNSTIVNTTRNARFILKILDRNDIPVFSGAKKPLKRELIQAVVHGKSGLEGIDPENPAKLTNNAADKMLGLIKKYPKEITLVTLAPLTNIAEAIRKDPKTMMKIEEIIIMGGAIKVPGNKNRVAEFNIFVDPDAAKIVFDFPIKKTIVPLDACNNVRFQLKDLEKIKNKNLREILLKMNKPYIRNLKKDTGVKAALMYDPLTIFYLLEKNACGTNEDNVQIETKGIITRGMTVVDKRKITDGLIPNVTIVNYINGNRFRERFIDTLNSE